MSIIQLDDYIALFFKWFFAFLGFIGVAIILSGIGYFIFAGKDVAPFMNSYCSFRSSQDNSITECYYEVKMNRSFGKDRTLFISTDSNKAIEFYSFLLKNNFENEVKKDNIAEAFNRLPYDEKLSILNKFKLGNSNDK